MGLSKADLLQKQTHLLSLRDNLKTQIDAAKSTAASTGHYSDPVWFQTTSWELRKVQRKLQEIQLAIGEAGRKERALEDNVFEKQFVEVARLMLTSEVFHNLMQEAKARVENGMAKKETA